MSVDYSELPTEKRERVENINDELDELHEQLRELKQREDDLLQELSEVVDPHLE